MMARRLSMLFVVLFGPGRNVADRALVGPRGGRQRLALVRERRHHLPARQTPAVPPRHGWHGELYTKSRPLPPPNYGLRTEDGRWWWDGRHWNPVNPPMPTG